MIRGLSVVISLGAMLCVVSPRAQSSRAGSSSDASPQPRSTAIVPFKIHVSDDVLSDLKQRLTRARFADELSDAGWDYGTNLAYLKTLAVYWRDKYDWRAQERRLNEFEQFKTNIDGLDIHFIHRRSKVPGAVPLLLLNGWPSSIVEYAKVIGPLVEPGARGGQGTPAFDVVIPSMPGYGFSDKPRTRGYNPERMSDIWATLMARLGYARYMAHGSDWGIAVASYLAVHDGAHMAALHLAGCPGGGTAPLVPPPSGAPPALVSSNLGYQEIQTTKPQTLGQGLSDSPLGLASWVIDKWQSWSDHDGDLEKVYTRDELLTNIMIYWVTNSGTSSARLYYESRHVDGRLLPTFFEGFLPRLPEGRVTVPTGCGAFPSQFDRRGTSINFDADVARRSAEARYNVVHSTISRRGGHFPALEQPQAWMDDLRAFTQQRGHL